MTRYSFTEHPASVGETYTQHLRTAWTFSAAMVAAGIACFVHGLLPFLFVRTGSQTVASLNDRMVTNRISRSASSPGAIPGSR